MDIIMTTPQTTSYEQLRDFGYEFAFRGQDQSITMERFESLFDTRFLIEVAVILANGEISVSKPS